jgi:hypothetical protein
MISVADPECYIQNPGSNYFLISDPESGNKHFFLDPGSYMKSGIHTYFILASYAFRSQVLVLVMVKKVRDPGLGI